MHHEAMERSRAMRSHSPIVRESMARTAAALDAIRVHQVQGRYGVPERYPIPLPPPMVREVTIVKTFTHHQDAFLSDLQNEVNELRMQQKDYHALQEQFRYLQDQYTAMQADRSHFENDCNAKITEDRKEVDTLIVELDHLKVNTAEVEKEQVELLNQISMTERDVQAANNELVGMRHECSAVDATNLNERKEISHLDSLCADQKEVNHANYGELCRMKDISYNLDRDIATSVKNVNVLRADLDNNDQRINSLHAHLTVTEQNIQTVLVKVADAHAHISDLKVNLNTQDGEIGYFEHLNEQHKAAQGQLFKASDYEYTNGKDGGLHHQDLQVTLNKLLQDE